MKRGSNELGSLELRGLTMAPSQVWGGIRLVPLLRRRVREDLRIARRAYGEDLTLVRGLQEDPHAVYCAYVPHGLVVSWGEDGLPAAAFGTQLERRDGKVKRLGCGTVRLAHRMVKREEQHRLRLLPLHLAMEGFLAQHFDGPDIAWSEYAQSALAYGLSPRVETAYSGRAIAWLEDALRVFEIHPDQVGVLIFVADALGSAFVVSHPEDYRALHQSLVEDFYGELLVHYALLYPGTGRIEPRIDPATVERLADLRPALEGLRRDWESFQRWMGQGLIQRPLISQRAYALGDFRLQRFMTELVPHEDNHIGEAIVREDGEVEYLKSYRLSDAQVRRAYLLSQLALHRWNLAATAQALRHSEDELVVRLERAGFGYLLKPHVLAEARKRLNQRS